MKSRITVMRGAAICLLASSSAAFACESPTEVQGIKTCADVAAAEKEGSVTIYVSDPEEGDAKLVAEFTKTFPKIEAHYVRLSTAALYAKVLAEKQANATQVDVLQLGDIGLGLDFQKRGGYSQYESAQMDAYKPEYHSDPAGYFTWGSVIMAGIAYNPSTVADADAPKSWKELLEDKWNGEVTFKGANSGMQHLGWYEVRKLYGDAYWQHFEKYKARAFDSMVQQYERIANGKDKIAGGAQYSGFLSVKAKGAPVTFVVPTEGMPAGPEVWGVVEGGPHPQAGRLFLDWFLSQPGQSVMAKAFGLHSVRAGVDPPPGGIALADMKLLLPDDWHDFLQSKVEFNREWKMITGQ